MHHYGLPNHITYTLVGCRLVVRGREEKGTERGKGKRKEIVGKVRVCLVTIFPSYFLFSKTIFYF